MTAREEELSKALRDLVEAAKNNNTFGKINFNMGVPLGKSILTLDNAITSAEKLLAERVVDDNKIMCINEAIRTREEVLRKYEADHAGYLEILKSIAELKKTISEVEKAAEQRGADNTTTEIFAKLKSFLRQYDSQNGAQIYSDFYESQYPKGEAGQ